MNLDISTYMITKEIESSYDFMINRKLYCTPLQELISDNYVDSRNSIKNTNLYQELHEDFGFVGVPGIVEIFIKDNLLEITIEEVEVFWVDFSKFLVAALRSENNIFFYHDSLHLRISQNHIIDTKKIFLEVYIDDSLFNHLVLTDLEIQQLLGQAKSLFTLLNEITTDFNYHLISF